VEVPSTVETALADRPVAGARCLEAGAGVGNATAGLLAAGAARVHAVTTHPSHARAVRERVARAGPDRAARTDVLEADVRALPLSDDSVDVITAHALFNVLAPAALDGVAAELARVAAPGCHLVVDDYEPPPAGSPVRDLFAVENAASELARGRPALAFYPSGALRRLFVGSGWTLDRELTLLDPVPWTADHLAAHVEATRGFASTLSDGTGDRLVDRARRLADAVGSASVGEMYGLAFRRPP
jgi:SAM-dependent methyltransferase